MITKELLKEKFPQFNIHKANFAIGPFYLMTYRGLSFHIEIINEQANVKAYEYSGLRSEGNIDVNNLIEYINKRIIEYDTY